ncbi:MAG: phosphate ABC transporter permease subunit PstC [Thermoplasmata archaeon]|nr:phosphate ABC transporter permease subunit PstC [Thermoplasmata archaeon]MCI4359247.1 phosphate ABC transporter permease subunit PstC [Thermoplasmata archaeon]
MTATQSPADCTEAPPYDPAGRPPTPAGRQSDRRLRLVGLNRIGRAFHGLAIATAAGVVALLGAVVLVLLEASGGSSARTGPAFLVGQTWDPVHNVYGALPAISGTIATSGLALLFAVPVAIGVAIFLTEFVPRRLREPIAALVDLSAAVPSVVWGFWAILVVAPFVGHSVEPVLARWTGGAGPFARPPTGFDVLSASVVLAIMVLPTISAISRSALGAVPRSQREAALSLGATRSEAAWLSVLRPARSGIVAGILLGFGRAAGEAVIVVGLIGNVYALPTSLFAQGQTIAGEILNDLNSGLPPERSALVELGLLLLVVTVLVQLAARGIVRWAEASRPRFGSDRSGRATRILREFGSGGLPPDPGPGAPAAPGRRPHPRTRPGHRRIVRRARGIAAVALTGAATTLALLPLVSVLGTAISFGGVAAVHPSFYTSELPAACPAIAQASCPIGGIGPAIQGTLLLVGLASLVAVPVGILAGVYLSEYGRGRGTSIVRLAADLLVGIPSVLIGLFVVVVLLQGAPALDNTALAGALALGVLMVPIVTRATEEALKAVPQAAREAALALGFPRHRATIRVVLPSARYGLITGIFLAVARAGGETAAVVLTAFGSPYWFAGLNHPVSSLTLVIFEQGSQSSYSNWQADAWGAALVLLVLMLGVSVAARLMARGATRPDPEA